MSFRAAYNAVLGHSGYNQPSPSFYIISKPPNPPGGSNDGLVLGLHPLQTDINSFLTVTDYLRYYLTNCAHYIDPDTNLSLEKLNRKLELLYPTFEPLSKKDPMDLFGFLTTTPEDFK